MEHEDAYNESTDLFEQLEGTEISKIKVCIKEALLNLETSKFAQYLNKGKLGISEKTLYLIKKQKDSRNIINKIEAILAIRKDLEKMVLFLHQIYSSFFL